ERLLGVAQGIFHLATLFAADLVAVLAQHLLDLVNHAVELVPALDLFLLGLVFRGVRIGFFRHALYFFLAQAGRRRDRDFLVFAGGIVLRHHVQDAVGVDVKRHLDLRHSTRSRR